MEKIEIIGIIDVIVEDKAGNVKYQSVNNKLTRAAMTQVLAVGLSCTDGLKKIFGSGDVGNGQIVTALPSQFGIYCLNKPVSITPDTISLPFLLPDQVAIDVTTAVFYNDSPDNLGEGFSNEAHGLKRVDSMCAMSTAGKVRYTFEYRNPVDANADPVGGEILSVVLGQSAEQLSVSPIGVIMTRHATDLSFGGNGMYALYHTQEHGIPTTNVVKQWDNGDLRMLSTLSGKVSDPLPDFLDEPINNYAGVSWSGGLLVDNGDGDYALVKTALVGATDVDEAPDGGVDNGSVFVRLFYKYGNLLSMTDAAPLDLELSDEHIIVNQASTPILVSRGENIEVFISGGVYNGVAKLYRQRIPIASLCDGSVVYGVWEHVGVFPFVFGCKTSKTADKGYFTGFWDISRKEYYLPVSRIVDSGLVVEFGAPGVVFGACLAIDVDVEPPTFAVRRFVLFANNYTIEQIGCVESEDPGEESEEEPSNVCYDYYGSYQFVHGKNGVGQMVVVGTEQGKTMCDVVIDTVWSGANLPIPIIKEDEDILRVVYSFEIGRFV